MLAMSSKLAVVLLSPSGNSHVCAGDQLELICSLTDPGSSLLEWTFAPATVFMDLYRAIDTNSVNEYPPWMINSTSFTFSRLSASGIFPLVSRLLITPLTIGLNGIVINCTDVLMMKTASTTIHVLNRPKNSMLDNCLLWQN